MKTLQITTNGIWCEQIHGRTGQTYGACALLAGAKVVWIGEIQQTPSDDLIAFTVDHGQYKEFGHRTNGIRKYRTSATKLREAGIKF